MSGRERDRKPGEEADTLNGPPWFKEAVVRLPDVPVVVHVYFGSSWDGKIDDKIEGNDETAIVSYERLPAGHSLPGNSHQVWVDGQNVSYRESHEDAVAYIVDNWHHHHLFRQGKYVPPGWKPNSG